MTKRVIKDGTTQVRYHVEKRETEKEYNEFHVLGVQMSILIYNKEDIQ